MSPKTPPEIRLAMEACAYRGEVRPSVVCRRRCFRTAANDQPRQAIPTSHRPNANWSHLAVNGHARLAIHKPVVSMSRKPGRTSSAIKRSIARKTNEPCVGSSPKNSRTMPRPALVPRATTDARPSATLKEAAKRPRPWLQRQLLDQPMRTTGSGRGNRDREDLQATQSCLSEDRNGRRISDVQGNGVRSSGLQSASRKSSGDNRWRRLRR
jgi:hypothetical protein